MWYATRVPALSRLSATAKKDDEELPGAQWDHTAGILQLGSLSSERTFGPTRSSCLWRAGSSTDSERVATEANVVGKMCCKRRL